MPAARFDAYKTIAAASITTAFQAVGTPLGHAVRIFRLLNNTNGNLIMSVDTINNNFYLPAFSFLVIDVTANTDTVIDSDITVQAGTQWYVKYDSGATTPSTGALYIEHIYANINTGLSNS